MVPRQPLLLELTVRLRGSAMSRVAARCAVLLGMWCVGCVSPQDPQPPGGGQPLPLDFAVFVEDIEPILQQRGCSNAACHGGQGSGELLLSGGNSPQADFDAVRGHVTPWEPELSPLLRKPLAVDGGGDVHGGGDVFPDTTDSDYQTLLHWVTPEATP